jgi:hypothetical protein
MQWFCQHDPANGAPRDKPYTLDFTQPNGVALAACVLQWLADGMPGLEYQRKALRLVRHASATIAALHTLTMLWYLTML